MARPADINDIDRQLAALAKRHREAIDMIVDQLIAVASFEHRADVLLDRRTTLMETA